MTIFPSGDIRGFDRVGPEREGSAWSIAGVRSPGLTTVDLAKFAVSPDPQADKTKPAIHTPIFKIRTLFPHFTFSHSRKSVLGMQAGLEESPMANYDIFNGDADGICALLQLRLAEPRKAKLITGVKRDINLLERVNAKRGDHLTVLDISMRTNQVGLGKALNAGANVFYVDHHNAGDIPRHENLFAVIDTRPTTCTSLLVNKCLDSAFADWAIVGAFGDNMSASANALADKIGLSVKTRTNLKKFGELINYNGYGSNVIDLHFPPTKLFKLLSPFQTPQEVLKNRPDIFDTLQNGLNNDLGKAKTAEHIAKNVTLLEDAKWARRISGSFGNILANQNPENAHAVLTHNTKGGFTVSVRSPLNNPKGADKLCLNFPSGGGRAGAAGINHLPKDELDKFLAAFSKGF